MSPAPLPEFKERHFAYYSSGHGYGHATRVSAVTSSLLAAGHAVTIVTNAPTQPFSAVLPSFNGSPKAGNALPRYATYRFANIDAGIVQPKAYDVDRKATFEVLKTFMDKREERLGEEEKWLREAGVDAVLSDAAFLACAAAGRAGIPSVLISNFTFDSCYSYLSLPPLPPRASTSSSSDEEPEPALPASLLLPFVSQAIADYQHASLLLRLPGSIPIPAFDTDVSLPAGTWVNDARTAFTPSILSLLSRPPSTAPCTSPHPNPSPRWIVDVPLIVRPPSPNVHSPSFRAALLSSLGVPTSQHAHKVLLVSFGGQSIPRPRSRPPSPLSTSPLVVEGSFEANVNGFLKGGREAGLLPPGWIAIVCGLSGVGNEIRKDLPEGFFASEKDVYVPDLTATADVVLGKLGYGTCSETLSCHTPFVYVPRPLFVEEFGLKRLMQQRGTSLELDRADFEAGRWEFHVAEAYERGREEKEESRRIGYVCEGAGRVIVREIERFLKQSE